MNKLLVTILVGWIVLNLLWLGSMPGLLGDEGSEGQNVHELLTADHITVRGERSYIGPLIDYVRVPWVGVFGYTAFALRLPVVVLSVLAFMVAVPLCRELFGKEVAPYALVALFFSPMYLSYQRLGWAITLVPLLALFALWLFLRGGRHAALLGGLVLGLGLHNHILFLASAVAIVAVVSVQLIRQRQLLSYWPAAIGLVAGLNGQLYRLLTMSDDQGDIAQVVSTFGERLREVPYVLPYVISGSSFFANYTGRDFSRPWLYIISAGVLIVIGAGMFLAKKRLPYIALAAGLAIHTVVLIVMIDRFAPRYFVTLGIGIWCLAGAGLGEIMHRFTAQWPRHLHVGPLLLALCLAGWWGAAVAYPFLTTGGSPDLFHIGKRSERAESFLDIRPLLACIEGAGPVATENVHIYNRLMYLSHQFREIMVISEYESKQNAQWVVQYRRLDEDDPPRTYERCPQLTHWRVVLRDRGED
jgi:uncharacterized membrane protein